MAKRFHSAALTIVLAPAIALAIPTDASIQNQVTASGGLAVRVDSPSEQNEPNGPDGRVFCTLFDTARCVPISKASCENGDKRIIQFVITPSTAIPANSRMYTFATTGACSFQENVPPTPAPVSVDLPTSANLVNGRASTWPNDFSGGTSGYDTVAGLMQTIGACNANGVQNQRWNLCIGISLASGGATAPNALPSGAPLIQALFLVDTVVPDPPSTFEVSGGDAEFIVNVGQATNSSEISKYIIRYRPIPDPAFDTTNDDCSTWTDFKEAEIVRQGTSDEATSFTVSNIENNQSFEVCAAARDLAGNTGTFSPVVTARTHNECDFIECFPGPPPTGYCGAVQPSMLGLWALVALLARRSLRRKLLTVAPALLLTLGATSAKAQLEPPLNVWEAAEAGAVEKAPHFGFELRLGPMRPDIGNAAAQHVYNTIFDGDSLFAGKPMMIQIEVDYYLFNRLGLLGLFGRIGHWRASGHTRNCATPDQPDLVCTADTLDTSVQGASKTSLTIVPFTAGVVYKFDLIKERTWVPLVPYAKAAVDYYLWSNSAAGKTSTASDGSKGHGGQIGVNGSLGLALNLDWIDTKAATNARTGAHITDSYLFFEATAVYGNIRSQSLDFSSNYFLAGLALDFF